MLRKTLYRGSTFGFLLTLLTQAAWSAGETSIFFPRIGRIALSADGTVENTPGGKDIGIFGGDAMQPVYGNADGFLFADFMGDRGTNSTYLLSPGAGYRVVVNNQIWGAYVFGDNEEVSLGKNFWNISPGIEWMTPHWDMHANGYFPTNQTQQMGAPVFANTLGNYNYVNFVNGTHDQYDALTAPYDVIGNGVDVAVGYRFAGTKNLTSRVYVGGYYYHPSSNDFIAVASTNVKNITGITAGFEQSVTKNFRFSLMSSYDSVSTYTISAGIQISFGDNSTLYSDNVHDRLLEPIPRHVGIIGTGAGTYDQLGYKDLGNTLEYTNIYFVSPGGTGNGTYGSPMSLAQSSLDMVNAESPNSSRLYLQGGDPVTYAVNSTNAGVNGLLLYNGQDLYGRSANYTAPASSGEQPLISVDGATVNHGFYIQSGENTFNDLAITASSLNVTGTTAGIYVVTNTSATVNVVNTSITALNIGLYAKNEGTENLVINATNSQFNDNTDSLSGTGAYGIYAANNSTGNLTINATSSQFNGNTNTIGNNSDVAFGIYASNNSAGNLIINAMNSSFNDNLNAGLVNDGAAGISVHNDTGNLTINATNSFFNGNKNIGTGQTTSGIIAFNGTGNLTINATNSQFNENSSVSPQVDGLYVTGLGNVNLNLTDSSFNGNTVIGPANGGANGVFLSVSNLNMNVTNSTFNGNINNSQNAGTGSIASGIEILVSGSGSINVINSQFNGNQALNGGGNVGVIAFYLAPSGTANLAVNVSGSQFNDNVATGDGNGGASGLSIDTSSSNLTNINISNSQFNGNTASGNNNAGSTGFYAYNEGTGGLTISATQSQFNTNTASGTGASAEGFGFYADNSMGNSALSVTSLSGSIFDNNSTYGLFAKGNTSAAIATTISLFNTTFFGNPTSWGSSGYVTFTE